MDSFISTPNEIAVVRKIERAVRKSKPIPILDMQTKKEDEVYEPFGSENETVAQQEFSIPY